jgi:hypothetical protein
MLGPPCAGVDPTCCKDIEGGTRQRRALHRSGDSQGLAAVDRALNLKCPRVHCHHAPRPAHTKAVTRQLRPPQGTCPGLDHVTHCTKDLTRRRRCGPQAEDAGRVVHLLSVKSECKTLRFRPRTLSVVTFLHACSAQSCQCPAPSCRARPGGATRSQYPSPAGCGMHTKTGRQQCTSTCTHLHGLLASCSESAPLRLSHARPWGTVALWRWHTVWGTQAQVGDDAFVDHRTNVTVFPSL